MSISTAQKGRLGIFIIVSVVLFVFTIILGLGLKLTKKSSLFYSEFSGESLSGLSKGMEVKFHGIPIGRVSSISYDPNDLTKVVVELSVEKSFPMKKDMVVETGMLGITGLKYVEIMGGTSEAEILPEGSMIPSKPSLMASITDKADLIMNKAVELLDNLTTLTNPDSLGEINEILTNVNSMTKNLDSLLVKTSPELESMAQNLNSTIHHVDSLVGVFSEEANLSKFINNIDSTVVSIKELTDGMNLTFRQSKEDLAATMIDIKQTIENLNDLSQLLVENPSLLLRGSPQKKRKLK